MPVTISGHDLLQRLERLAEIMALERPGLRRHHLGNQRIRPRTGGTGSGVARRAGGDCRYLSPINRACRSSSPTSTLAPNRRCVDRCAQREIWSGAASGLGLWRDGRRPGDFQRSPRPLSRCRVERASEADRLRAAGINKSSCSPTGLPGRLQRAPRWRGIDLIVSGHDHAPAG